MRYFIGTPPVAPGAYYGPHGVEIIRHKPTRVLLRPSRVTIILAILMAILVAVSRAQTYGPVIGVQNIDAEQINPATEDTLKLIKLAVDVSSTSGVFIRDPITGDKASVTPCDGGSCLEVRSRQVGSFSVSIGTEGVVSVSSYTALRVDISVTAGSGSSIFSSTATFVSCAVVPPVGATYDFEIVTNDADEFPVLGRSSLTGKVGLTGSWAFVGSHKMQITAASLDGTYKARCIASP